MVAKGKWFIANLRSFRIEFQRLEEHTMTRVGPVGWAERLLQQPSHSGKDAGSGAPPPCLGCGRWGLLGAPVHTA